MNNITQCYFIRSRRGRALDQAGTTSEGMFFLPSSWALDIKRNTTAFAPLPFSVRNTTQAARRPDENIPFLLRNPFSVSKCHD